MAPASAWPGLLSLLILLHVVHCSVAAFVDFVDPAPVRRIAFASCSKHNLPQPMWGPILDYRPDVFIWTGDIVYADHTPFPLVWVEDSLASMAHKYRTQAEQPDYRRLAASTKVLGVWDDHDYGQNNGDGRFRLKEEVKAMLLAFLKEPADSVRWTREGMYASYLLGPPQSQVLVVLLDVRYFAEPPSATADLLGSAQWAWLQRTLEGTSANVTLLVSGIQVLGDIPVAEKWGKYPASARRLLHLLSHTTTSGAVLISGDIHLGEFLCEPSGCAGGDPFNHTLGYPLLELTSSGLTHTCESHFGKLCVLLNYVSGKRRIFPLVRSLNFGVLDIHWGDPSADPHPEGPTAQGYATTLSTSESGHAGGPPHIAAKLVDVQGRVVAEHRTLLSDLQFGGHAGGSAACPTPTLLATHPLLFAVVTSGLLPPPAVLAAVVLASCVGLYMCLALPRRYSRSQHPHRKAT